MLENCRLPMQLRGAPAFGGNHRAINRGLRSLRYATNGKVHQEGFRGLCRQTVTSKSSKSFPAFTAIRANKQPRANLWYRKREENAGV
eukprot:50412-Pyramimonas_sp.AAC.1